MGLRARVTGVVPVPTNLLRKRRPGRPATATEMPVHPGQRRVAVLKVRRLAFRLELHATPTADRIWAHLPFHSTVETWGATIHFETHLEWGRDRTARLNVSPGDIAYWSEDDRIIVAWGPSPISRPGEIRLMRPCNIWAHALDDLSPLASVTPGERVTLAKAP